MTLTGAGNHPPIFYLVSSSQAVFLGGNGVVDFGFFQSQSGSSFSNSSLNGAYAFGTIDPESSNSGDDLGVATFTSPNVSVIDDNNSNGSQSAGQTQSFTYSVNSSGLATIPSGCTVSATSTTCSTLIYIISPTKGVVMDATSGSPKVQLADQ
jgi:hypothetical protein